jgi:hypothetical protein
VNAAYHSVHSNLSSYFLPKNFKIKIYKIYNFFLSCTLRRIFGPKREDVTGEWRRLHSQELCNLSSQNVIRVMKSMRMTWRGM